MAQSANAELSQVEQAIRGIPGRLFIAYSGGADSRRLLRLAHQVAPTRIILSHFNHAWGPASDDWQAQAAEQASQLGIPFVTATDPAPTRSEAGARQARYAWFSELLQDGDALLLGHHRQDQIETRWMRSSAGRPPRGMPKVRRLALGHLIRPLLDCPPVSDPLALQDPANQDTQYRRVAVRQLISDPRVAREVETLARLGELFDRVERVLVRALPAGDFVVDSDLSADQQARALAAWVWRRARLPAPPQRRLQALAAQLPAKSDRHPSIQWPVGDRTYALRAYQGRVLLEPAVWTAPAPHAPWRPLGSGEAKALHRLGVPPWHRPWVWRHCDQASRIRWWRPNVDEYGQISLEYVELND